MTKANIELEKQKIINENKLIRTKKNIILIIAIIISITIYAIIKKILESEYGIGILMLLGSFGMFCFMIYMLCLTEIKKTPEERLEERRIASENERLENELRMTKKQPALNRVAVPVSPREARRYTCGKLEKKFRKAGFYNINIKGNNHPILTWFRDENDYKVDSVLISGVDIFKKGDYYPSSSTITIRCSIE